MRRLAAIVVVSGSLIAAGCGGAEQSSTALDASLAYLPADSPFAVAVDTDLEGAQYKAVDSILARFPLEDTSVEGLLRDQLGARVNWERDIKPLLGNPLVAGAENPAALMPGARDDFVAALEVEDRRSLDDLIESTKAEKRGELAGATRYRSGGSVFAVEEDMVVLASSEELLDEALERADGDDHLDEQGFGRAFDGLPQDGPLRAYADMEALLASDPDLAGARKVKWVAALKTLGLTATASQDRLEIRFNLRTDPEGLSDEDLPMAAGEDAPPVIAHAGEIGFGIRDLAHIVGFAEEAGQAVDPSGYGDYAKAKQTLEAQLDVDLDRDLIGQLSGDLSASVALDGGFGLRAELDDPARFERTLDKLAELLPGLASGAGLGPVTLERPSGADRFYALAQADGDAVVFGVAGGVFVLATDPKRAAELAAEEPEHVPGAKGAVAMSSDAQELVNALIARFGAELGLGGLERLGARLVTDPFEDLTGSMSVDAEGLHGRMTLAFE